MATPIQAHKIIHDKGLNKMADTIRIDDLAQPQLTDAQRAALEYGETLSVILFNPLS